MIKKKSSTERIESIIAPKVLKEFDALNSKLAVTIKRLKEIKELSASMSKLFK